MYPEDFFTVFGCRVDVPILIYQEHEKLAELKFSFIYDEFLTSSNETDESQVMLDIYMS